MSKFWKPEVLSKLFYCYAFVCGMVNFKITHNHRVQYSKKHHIFSVINRFLSCVGVVLCSWETCLQILGEYRPNMWVIHLTHLLITQVFAFTLITWQIVRYKKFIRILNEFLDLFSQIQYITGKKSVFGSEVYIILLFRLVCDLCAYFVDIPNYLRVSIANEFYYPFLAISVYAEAIGSLLVLHVTTLGYLLFSGMYLRIGKHLEDFAQRITKLETYPTTNYREMAILCELSDELDECSMIYSKIYQLLSQFHFMFQMNVLLVLVVNFIMVISYVHQSFVTYINTAEIPWGHIIFGIIRILDFLLFLLVIELISQRSQIPHNLNWDTFCSDRDARWDKSVDQFLAQLKLQEFKLDIYGLFLLDNELCLFVSSLIVAYLTILIQFEMMN